jgi:mannan endo-1,4-beta-mannosidase
LAHTYLSDKTEFSIKEISSLGANSALIVLSYGTKWNKTPITEIENIIINWCEKEGLIYFLELHDFTGSNKAKDIIESAFN